MKRDVHGLLVTRNRIYRNIFTDGWARKTMPPLARTVRAARRGTMASVVLLLLTAGIWYEGIYPYQLTNRLNKAIAEDRYALDTYELLRGIPFYSARAKRLWAGLFDRRAIGAKWREQRDLALLWTLKALSVLPSDRRSREAGSLIGEDYPQLVRTIQLSAADSSALSADGSVIALAKGRILSLLSTESGTDNRQTIGLRRRRPGHGIERQRACDRSGGQAGHGGHNTAVAHGQ